MTLKERKLAYQLAMGVATLRHLRVTVRAIRFYRASCRIMPAAFAAIIAVGVLVLPEVMVGITEASTTRRLPMP